MITAFDRVRERLAERTGSAGRNGMWKCPAHDDGTASLSVKCAADGSVLMHCFAGCDTGRVVDAIGLELKDLFEANGNTNGHRGRGEVVATYPYTDEYGELLYQVQRLTPKNFTQRRPDGRGEWLWRLGDVRRVPYRLPQVLAAIKADRWVLVVEGEKDVDRLAGAELVATCNSGGAERWRAEWAHYFANAKVCVLPDNDDPGRAHATQVARSLHGVARELKIIELPGLDEHGDVSDWLTAGHEVDELRRLITDAPECSVDDLNLRIADAPSGQQVPSHLTLAPASSVRIDRPRWVWEGRIPVGGTTLLAGREGLGKTALVCHLAGQITRGDLPGEWHGRPADVVYIGHEDDRSSVLVPRLVAAGADLDRFLFVNIDGSFMVNVDTDALAEAAASRDVALIVLDPLDSHLGSVDSHKKAEVQASIQHLADVAQQLRCGALGLAHLNKSTMSDLLAKVVGSVGFTTSTRSVLAVGEHPEQPTDRVCVLAKSNMCDKTSIAALRFRVEQAFVPHPDGGDPIDTGRVVVLGEEHGIDANSLIIGNSEERDALAVAMEWLASVLSDGPMPKAEIRGAARPEGIAERTLERAASRLGVVIKRDDDSRGRPSTWRLPDYAPWVSRQTPLAHNRQSADQGERLGTGHYAPLPENGVKPPVDESIDDYDSAHFGIV